MKQEIYEDPYGLDAWDQRYSSRCFVTIANSLVWTTITGERPPTTPPTAADYTRASLPWFDYYGSDAKALESPDCSMREAKNTATIRSSVCSRNHERRAKYVEQDKAQSGDLSARLLALRGLRKGTAPRSVSENVAPRKRVYEAWQIEIRQLPGTARSKSRPARRDLGGPSVFNWAKAVLIGKFGY